MNCRPVFVVTVAAVLVGVIGVVLMGCSRSSQPEQSSSPSAPVRVQLVSSEKARATARVGESDLAQLVAGNTAFALDLFQVLAGPDGPKAGLNFVVSPYSISTALAMTYSGARGETAKEMADALHFTLPDERLHPAFNVLDRQLATRNQTSAPGIGARVPGSDVPLEWRAVNQLWGQQGYEFLPGFLDLLATQYGAGMRLVDFEQAPEPSRLAINSWVAGQTRQRIKDLLPPHSLDEPIRLVLTNALYLYAPWQRPFYPEATEEGDFSRPDGTGVKASFMNQTDETAYGAGDGWQAVELPYRGNELALLAIVPDDGRFAEFGESFDPQKLQQVVGSLAPRLVSLALPKLQMTSDISLRDALEALGMTQAFQPRDADLSGMDGMPHNLFVSGVFHQGFIAVDEEGTEAAAATAVVVAGGVATTEIQPLKLRIDRPFLWVIVDVPTGTVLFVGQVVDPSA